MGKTYTLAQISKLVRSVAPTLYLHDDERYLPSSVDWYLARAEMVAKTGERIKLADGPGAPDTKLKRNDTWPFNGDSADYWLEVSEETLYGDLASARSYVTIRTVKPGFLDISFWFWYPGNGCGTARLRTLAFDSTVFTTEAVALTTLGFHVSDWEKITVRVTDDDTNTLSEVYFAQHSGGHWLKPDQLQRDTNGNIVVCASRNGHASYPDAGEHYSAHIKTAPDGVWAKLTPSAIEIWLRNDAMKGTRSVDCAVNHEIVSIQDTIPLVASPEDASLAAAAPFYGRSLSPGATPTLAEPAWLQYPYRWGPETEQTITHEVVFEALKAAIGPLAVYGALTVGAMLPLLGAVAGLLAPYYVKMETENGKPGPKVKYTSDGVVDQESEPEPDNLFTDAVNGGLSDMVDWVEKAGRDVATWTAGAGGAAVNWTEGAAGTVANWTEGAAGTVVNWGESVANPAIHWAEGAANSTASWFTHDVADWATGAADTVVTWGGKLNPMKW